MAKYKYDTMRLCWRCKKPFPATNGRAKWCSECRPEIKRMQYKRIKLNYKNPNEGGGGGCSEMCPNNDKCRELLKKMLPLMCEEIWQSDIFISNAHETLDDLLKERPEARKVLEECNQGKIDIIAPA